MYWVEEAGQSQRQFGQNSATPNQARLHNIYQGYQVNILLGRKGGVLSSPLGRLVLVRNVVETRGGVSLEGDLLAVVDVFAPLPVRRLKGPKRKKEEKKTFRLQWGWGQGCIQYHA